jgi:hypothetical protein
MADVFCVAVTEENDKIAFALRREVEGGDLLIIGGRDFNQLNGWFIRCGRRLENQIRHTGGKHKRGSGQKKEVYHCVFTLFGLHLKSSFGLHLNIVYI